MSDDLVLYGASSAGNGYAPVAQFDPGATTPPIMSPPITTPIQTQTDVPVYVIDDSTWFARNWPWVIGGALALGLIWFGWRNGYTVTRRRRRPRRFMERRRRVRYRLVPVRRYVRHVAI